MPWPLKEPVSLLAAVLTQRLDQHDSIRHSALRLHARSEVGPIDVAFECRTAGGRLVYVKATQPLHELLTANTLAGWADAQARGRGVRVTFGPKIVKVRHHPDAVRKRNPAAGQMKVTVLTGAPIVALPTGCPCQLFVEGGQLEAAKVTAGDSASAREGDPKFAAGQAAPIDAHADYNWPEIARVDAEEYWKYYAKYGKAP